MEKSRYSLRIGGRNVVLIMDSIEDIISSIDVEDILKIDYSNIVGEILTFPVVLNRIGILKADADNDVRECKFKLEVYTASSSEVYRKSARTVKKTHDNKDRISDPTKDEVCNNVVTSCEYKTLKDNLITAEKNAAYMESFYWAAVSKDKKLGMFQDSLTPSDMEGSIVEGKCNGIVIKLNSQTFKTK